MLLLRIRTEIYFQLHLMKLYLAGTSTDMQHGWFFQFLRTFVRFYISKQHHGYKIAGNSIAPMWKCTEKYKYE